MAGNCVLQAHEPEYVRMFLEGALDSQAKRRIGFGDITATPVLIERTLSEVAGKPKGMNVFEGSVDVCLHGLMGTSSLP